jgi:N-acetylglucosamine-6-phosphate deacetylase
MKTVIDCGSLVFQGEMMRDLRVLIEEGVIRAVVSRMDTPADATLIDAHEGIVLPGFIDIHVHGAMDADTMDATPAALQTMAQFYASCGVTSFLPTTMTASKEETKAAIYNVGAVMDEVYAANGVQHAKILGAHVEGPFVNPEHCGAQPVQFMRPAMPEEYLPWFDSGIVKLITVAPEMDGCMDLIAEAKRRNIAVALGHTDATYAQSMAAFDAGANQATHTYNAMRGLHHREPGTVGATMTRDDVFAQLICDNIHVHPAAMKALYRCKGADRLALITDAMEATGLGDGEFHLGAHHVHVHNGEARLANGALAGSTLTMDAAFRNIIAATTCSIAEASRMASWAPASAIGVNDRKGKIAAGYDADLVILNNDLNVVRTIIGGK